MTYQTHGRIWSSMHAQASDASVYFATVSTQFPRTLCPSIQPDATSRPARMRVIFGRISTTTRELPSPALAAPHRCVHPPSRRRTQGAPPSTHSAFPRQTHRAAQPDRKILRPPGGFATLSRGRVRAKRGLHRRCEIFFTPGDQISVRVTERSGYVPARQNENMFHHVLE